MLQKKVVIRLLGMNDDKSRTKAMKIAVSAPGDDKNQIIVIGEGIDSTCLTVTLRKKVGYFTEIVSVTPIPGQKNDDIKKDLCTPPILCYPYQYGTPQKCWTEVREPQQDCTIM
ncbi:hypothetical protein AQUCO_15600002v1 [Aquilegia coerulea]|uniref:Uncharacterized protein n=1 Tax=Aquilegia coerulea TaxID=218851 RepID=A0A2G5C256_AQUCA|nr:hypothetical protein AQUCO_15600002v1 [Aquilegia coerulea]